MTLNIGGYKVKITAEDERLKDLTKQQVTEYFLNELSMVYDLAAEYRASEPGMDPEMRKILASSYRDRSEQIYEKLKKSGFYGKGRSMDNEK